MNIPSSDPVVLRGRAPHRGTGAQSSFFSPLVRMVNHFRRELEGDGSYASRSSAGAVCERRMPPPSVVMMKPSERPELTCVAGEGWGQG